MNEQKNNQILSDEIIIEIVHTVKDIIVELIDHAFKRENE